MLKTKIHVQNLAYCRYLHLWSIFYFCNMVESTPLISISATSLLHLYSLKLNTKRIGILAQDYILIAFIYKKNQELYLFYNIFVFLCYINALILLNINPIKLYMNYLPNDDMKYQNENYISYLHRIYYKYIVKSQKRYMLIILNKLYL